MDRDIGSSSEASLRAAYGLYGAVKIYADLRETEGENKFEQVMCAAEKVKNQIC